MQPQVTPDLTERLKARKGELLAILRPVVAPDRATTTPAAGEAELAEIRPGAAPEAIRWEDCLDPPDPCPECGTLELWQTLAFIARNCTGKPNRVYWTN